MTKIKAIKSFAILLLALFAILAGLHYREAADKARLAQSQNRSPIVQIISNSSKIQDGKYPLRFGITDDSTKEVIFLEPQALKEDTETAIIVLGDRPLDETTPTVDMVYRVLKGVELSQKFPKAILIMSGGATKGPTPEARMMGWIAWSRGVDPLRIILEDKSQTTEENAAFTAAIIGSKKIQRLFLITEPTRLEEAAAIFQKHGEELKNIQAIGSDVTTAIIIEQMEQFLKGHDDRIIQGRLHFLKKGIKSKAFKFAVFRAE